MKNKNSVVQLIKSIYGFIEDKGNFLYYTAGIWIAYMVNIYLNMTLSIVLSRFVLLCFIFYILVNHLSALRKSNQTG